MQIGDAAAQTIKDERRKRQKENTSGKSYGILIAILPDIKGSRIPRLGCHEPLPVGVGLRWITVKVITIHEYEMPFFQTSALRFATFYVCPSSSVHHALNATGLCPF